MTTQPQNLPPHIGMMQILNGIHIAGAVSCLARLGIPDMVEERPKSAEELAGHVGAEPHALYRLMRATASIGVLAEGPDGKFSQTPMSDVLRSDTNPSLRAMAIMVSREWHSLGWSRLEYCVRTGKQALDEIYGMPTFEYFRQNPEEARIFNDAMTGISSIDSSAVAGAYDFAGIGSIVDVGGGHGLLLATILEKCAQMNGTLYDLEHVISGASDGPLRSMTDRCTLTAGDMFTSVPAGADAYIMKHIIHDWQDEQCVEILKNCRKSVNPGGKLLVVDAVIQPGNDFFPGKFLDLQMLIFPGGRERTEQQFRDLFAASGWSLNRVIPTVATDSIVEGIPA